MIKHFNQFGFSFKPSRSVYQNPLMDRGVDVALDQTYRINGVDMSDNNGFLSAAYGAGSVDTAALAALAVTTAKIAALAVTTAKIAALAVTSAELGALAVETAKINNLAVTEGKIGAGAVTAVKVGDSDGTGGPFVRKFAQAVYDFSVDGGTEGTITMSDTFTVPDNAVVTAWHYDVITTFTSSGDAATIKLNLPTDGDLSTAIAISDGTDPWDAGAHLASVITPVAQKTTGARALQLITAGGQDLTAGKAIFTVEYYVSE